MRLIECYIENFGKISKQKFTFTNGFNCICQNNGEGKTTLTVFIKVMLYGMSDTKRAAISENERRHYLPWQGGTCGGYLTVGIGDDTYRIERTFAPKAADDTYRRVDLKTGAVCDDGKECFGERIFGIDAEAFERTVFHSEKSLSSKTDNKTISAKLSDLVGTDGDIGVMDDAFKRLEEQRKEYQKRGGSGKIADIRASITDTELKISEMARLEAELGELDTECEKISAEMDRLEAESKRLITERGRAIVAGAQRGNEKKYADLKQSTDELTKQKDAIISFFGGHVPSAEDVEKAALYHERAEELYEKIREATKDTDEYIELQALLAGRTTPERISEARAARDSYMKESLRMEELRRTRFGEVFKTRIPETSEIDEAISAASEKTRSRGALPLSVSLAVAAILAALGAFVSPLLYAAGGAVAIVGIILFIALRASETRRVGAIRKVAIDFVRSVTGREVGESEILSLLTEMRTLRAKASSENAGSQDLAVMREFIAPFGGGDPIAVTSEIIEKYEKYEKLSVKKSLIEESLRKDRSEADRLMLISRAFLSKCRTETDRPFDEIREHLREYASLTSKIIASRAQLEGLKLQSIEPVDGSTMTVEQIDAEGRRVDVRRAELERVRGAALKRRSECEYALLEKDTLTASLAEQKDNLRECEETLRVILLTQKYLKASADSITSKYLGATKDKFIKYLNEFGGADGADFDMDTTFGITKIDSGAARPLEAYSRGTRELYNIAARLAVCDSLYGAELPFLIFDDPFTSFDDTKVRTSLSLLRRLAERRQVIYLTCSVSRAINS